MGRKRKPLEKFKRAKENGEVVEPEQSRFKGYIPRSLNTAASLRAEMGRVYRFVWECKVTLEDACKLIACLDKMVMALKSEVELATIQNQYMEAWSGVNITPPAGEAALQAPAPHAAIEGPKQQSEDDNDET